MASKTTQRLTLSLAEQLGANGRIRLILASQSPRRREILDMMGLVGRYDVIPSTLNETALQEDIKGVDNTKDVNPVEYTKTLAREKAHALIGSLAKSTEKPTLVVGSDTIVDMNSRILEKPRSEAEAKQMLSQLSGNSHFVHTGVAVYKVLPGGSFDLVSSFVDTATVQFAQLEEVDIDAYIATGEPMDKAGSYGIQGIGGQFVKSVQGDFFTIADAPDEYRACGCDRRPTIKVGHC